MSLHVVIAVIEKIQDGKPYYLIAKRAQDKHQGGLWEFPGGKVENNESAEHALYRELREEIGIDVTASVALCDFAYDYPDKSIHFFVYKVTAYMGKEQGKENQEISWVEQQDLHIYEFPAANAKIIARLLES